MQSLTKTKMQSLGMAKVLDITINAKSPLESMGWQSRPPDDPNNFAVKIPSGDSLIRDLVLKTQLNGFV